MQFLRELFKNDSSKNIEAAVNRSLTKLKIKDNGELPHYFYEVVMET